MRNRRDNSFASHSSVVGMNTACFERRSTTTRMDVNPLDAGKCSIKSIEIESQGRDGIGSCLRSPYGL